MSGEGRLRENPRIDQEKETTRQKEETPVACELALLCGFPATLALTCPDRSDHKFFGVDEDSNIARWENFYLGDEASSSEASDAEDADGAAQGGKNDGSVSDDADQLLAGVYVVLLLEQIAKDTVLCCVVQYGSKID